MQHLRLFIALISGPVLVNAGALYDVSTRPVDQSNIALVAPNTPPSRPVVTHYFVDDGRVRIGGAAAKTVFVFKDRIMYVMDPAAKTAHVLKHATLSDLAAHYADAVKQLEDAAAAAAPENRAEAQRKAADMKEVSDRMRRPVTREFRVTVRFESVDGHACRVWEEREMDAKRLELCVAPVATVPGGPDILNGLKTLSRFRQGSNFALGVDWGLSDWWQDIATLGGIPLLIREYKYDSEFQETLLSAMSPASQDAAHFDIPQDYRVQEGPDYVQWYVR